MARDLPVPLVAWRGGPLGGCSTGRFVTCEEMGEMRLPRVHPRIDWPRHASRRLRPDEIASTFGKEISPRDADMLSLAMAVYEADRLTLRGRPTSDSSPSQRSWVRRLRIEVGVRDVPFWMSSTVRDTVVDL